MHAGASGGPRGRRSSPRWLSLALGLLFALFAGVINAPSEREGESTPCDGEDCDGVRDAVGERDDARSARGCPPERTRVVSRPPRCAPNTGRRQPEHRPPRRATAPPNDDDEPPFARA